MSAAEALKRRQRERFRTVETGDAAPEETPVGSARRTGGLKCSYRPAGADFYCWKYGVWYGLMDCCFRHLFRTYSGCAGCGQGRMNLKQHYDRFTSARHLGQRVVRSR
jgi:hypothetical protein